MTECDARPEPARLVHALRDRPAPELPKRCDQRPSAKVDEIGTADDLECEERRLRRAQERRETETRSDRPEQEADHGPNARRDPTSASSEHRIPRHERHVGPRNDDQETGDGDERAEVFNHASSVARGEALRQPRPRGTPFTNESSRIGTSRASEIFDTERRST